MFFVTGAFGKVYHGEMLKLGANTTKEEVAIKTIKRMIVTISVSISLD